jgi:hypothetical protein
MIIEFHIDQINEMLKFLDEVPHRYSRSLVDFIQAHTKKQLDAKQSVAEIQQPFPETVVETQQ